MAARLICAEGYSGWMASAARKCFAASSNCLFSRKTSAMDFLRAAFPGICFSAVASSSRDSFSAPDFHSTRASSALVDATSARSATTRRRTAVSATVSPVCERKVAKFDAIQKSSGRSLVAFSYTALAAPTASAARIFTCASASDSRAFWRRLSCCGPNGGRASKSSTIFAPAAASHGVKASAAAQASASGARLAAPGSIASRMMSAAA